MVGAPAKNKSKKPWALCRRAGNRCRFSESAICSSRVHPPSEIKSNFKFKTLRWRPLRWRLTLSDLDSLFKEFTVFKEGPPLLLQQVLAGPGFLVPGAAGGPGSQLHPGASDCATGTSMCLMAPSRDCLDLLPRPPHSSPTTRRVELKGTNYMKLNGTNGFLRKSAVSWGFLHSAPLKCCSSQERQKSAKLSENPRKTASLALFVPFSLSLFFPLEKRDAQHKF